MGVFELGVRNTHLLENYERTSLFCRVPKKGVFKGGVTGEP